MIKFYRIKDTEIRKVVEVDEHDESKKTVLAIIGQAGDLVQRGIISQTGEGDHEAEKYVIVPKENDGTVLCMKYATLSDAKNAALARFGKGV